jgi:hypothetical protein
LARKVFTFNFSWFDVETIMLSLDVLDDTFCIG